MRVKLDLGPDTQAKVDTDESGNVVSITLEPRFASASAHTVLAYGASVTDSGAVLDRFSLGVSGASGKIVKKSRTTPVKALVDMSDEERQSQGKLAQARDNE